MMSNIFLSALIALSVNCVYGASNTLPDRTKCGTPVLVDDDKIYGGSAVKFNEFPWIVLLQYGSPDAPMLGCAGTLVSSLYVLTAAHCVVETSAAVSANGPLYGVRLGEYSLESEQDCFNVLEYRECNDPAVVISVNSVLSHEQYRPPTHNDIALIRMNESINFSEFIRPICLPLPTENPTINDTLWVAGWGKTENADFSPVKLKARVPLVSNEQCAIMYNKRSRKIISANNICAGGQNGSCSGDSGGPLMQKTLGEPQVWILQGVVSSGGSRCGTNNFSGIYMRVSAYLEWITQNIEP